MIKNPPSNAGNSGLISDWERYYMPWSNEARAPPLPKCSPHAATKEFVLQQRLQGTQWRSCMLQLRPADKDKWMHLLKNWFLPVHIGCMRQGAQGWCTGMTLKDGIGKGGGREGQVEEHMYAHGWFMWMYGKNHPKIIIIIIIIKLKKINKTNFPVFFCHFHLPTHPVPSPSVPHHGVKNHLNVNTLIY